MRRSLSAFWIAIIISGLFFAGSMHFCDAHNDGSTLIPVAAKTSGENGSLELTMTIDKTSHSIGEPVNLTLTITNIGNQTINYDHTGLDFDFQVYNDTSNLVYQWSNFKAIAQFIIIEPMSPGESQLSQLHLGTNMEFQRTSWRRPRLNRNIQYCWRNWSDIQNTDNADPNHNRERANAHSNIHYGRTYGPTSSLTPTPAVPEFPTWINIALVVGVALLFTALKKKQE